MTADASALTEHASSAPTAPAGEIRALIEAFVQLGYDRTALLASSGLQSHVLDDPDARMPCDVYGLLFDEALRQRFVPNLALRLAQAIPFGTFALLEYLVSSASTVGLGLERLARYSSLVDAPQRLEIQENRGQHRLIVESVGPPFGVELTVALTIFRLRQEADGRFRPAEVSFRHRPDDAGEFEQALECPVATGADWAGFSVAAEAWDLPLKRGDPILNALLARQADARLPLAGAIRQAPWEVRRALAARLSSGELGIESVARELATSARTLQRQLAASGTSYQRVLDELRREAARRYLANGSLGVGEIAYLLGYSEPGPFLRAFKRWYGVTPQRYRTLRSPAA